MEGCESCRHANTEVDGENVYLVSMRRNLPNAKIQAQKTKSGIVGERRRVLVALCPKHKEVEIK